MTKSRGIGTIFMILSIDHSHNDVTLCFLLQLPECIVYYLSKDVLKHVVCLQSTFQFSGLMIKFQSFLVNGALEGSRRECSRFRLTDITQCIPVEVVVVRSIE